MNRFREPASRALRACMPLFLAVAASLPSAAWADTVASLLGNFTVNQYVGLALAPGTTRLHYVVVFGQLPALRELHEADADGDGVTTQEERDAYVARLAPDLATKLELAVDGRAVPLRAVHWTSSLPTEQSGFSMRIDIDFEGTLPAVDARRPSALVFRNRTYDGRIGWHEIAVDAQGLTVYDTDAFSDSLTNRLTDAIQTLPTTGPLDERAVRLRFVAGPLPAGERAIGRRADARGATARDRPTAASVNADAASTEWLQRRTHDLIGLISTPTVAPHVALLAGLAALVLGALHAFSPGHGKTIVGAYLIGSRSTPRHAVFLGVTVTITHTLVVFALGLGTLFASRFILPERLLPALSLLSGLLVLGMGLVLTMQRWPAARHAIGHLLLDRIERRRKSDLTRQDRDTGRPLAMRSLPARTSYGITRRSSALAVPHRHADNARHAPHEHHHQPPHGHAHEHAHEHAHHATDGMHSHGGTMHSHLPPGTSGEAVTWRSLLALGVSGGLVPCPSAMVLLLAAVALNKTLYGLVLVVAFSLGLAATLILVGLAFLYGRRHFARATPISSWPTILPAGSAVLITMVGLLLCYGALTSSRLGS